MNKIKNIGIDLVPMRPGSVNGGAKIFVVSLLKNLINVSSNKRFHIYVSSYEMKSELKNYFPNKTNIIISNNKVSKGFFLIFSMLNNMFDIIETIIVKLNS